MTAHSPTLRSLHLRHSSFSNPSFASPTSQALHLRHLASRPWFVWLLLMDNSTYTEYIELTCTVFILFIHKLLQLSFIFTEFLFGLSEISDLRGSDYRGYTVITEQF